jgi:DNA (cytosine-5)-methyltransferase 1
MATKCETEILTLNHYLELKADGYEFEGQSYLFWEFMRLLNECKPKYFLLENVEMGEKWEKVLSKAIGVNGIHINSALVSAQNRKRIYWTNIGMQPGGFFGDLVSIIEKPKDKGILLKDVLETEVDEKYFLSDKMISYFNAVEILGGDYRYDEGFRWRDNNKSGTLPARGRSEGNDFSGQALAKINNQIRRLTPLECERLQTVKDNYTNHVIRC